MNSKTCTIRNKKIILDSDLSEICQMETRVFNQTIKRNIKFFTEMNRFQLNNDEFSNLRSQFVISSLEHGGTRKLPFAFTKEGAEIAVKILKKDVDIEFLFEEKNESHLIVKNSDLRSKIHNIRNLQVILDFDLALLYEVTTSRLKEQVKRNPKRFPNDFMFQLSEDEINLMVSQNAIPSKQMLGGAKPFVFTEQGISSLSSVLTRERAIEINVNIMRTFVEMRKFIANNATVFQRLTNIEQNLIANNARLNKTDNNFDKIFKAIEENEIKM